MLMPVAIFEKHYITLCYKCTNIPMAVNRWIFMYITLLTFWTNYNFF